MRKAFKEISMKINVIFVRKAFKEINMKIYVIFVRKVFKEIGDMCEKYLKKSAIYAKSI